MAGSREGRRARNAARHARLVARIAGCVLAVRVSDSAGPSKHSVERDGVAREGAVDGVEDGAGFGGGVREGAAHPDLLRSLPGEDERDRHLGWLGVGARGDVAPGGGAHRRADANHGVGRPETFTP